MPPRALGMWIRRSGFALYPLRCKELMAFHLAAGVDHVARSTPGVRRPWFSVTRRTAVALAAVERTSSFCRRVTLRHCLSLAAFAILACILDTAQLVAFQLMECQLLRCEEATSPSMMASISTSWSGAGEGNRTLASCLGSNSSTIELHPPRARQGIDAPKGSRSPLGMSLRSLSSDRPPGGSQHSFGLGRSFHPLSPRLQRGVRLLHHPIPTWSSFLLAENLVAEATTSWAYHVPCMQQST